MNMKSRILLIAVLLPLLTAAGCGHNEDDYLKEYNQVVYAPQYALGFEIRGCKGKESTIIITKSPWQESSGQTKALFISRNSEKAPYGFKGSVIRSKAERIVCMSSSYIAMLEFIGESQRIKGVSGKRFVSSPYVRDNYNSIADVGPDGQTDYETIISLGTDLVILYGIGSASPMEDKLKELGIPYIYFGEYLEESPLGKAEWIVAMAELTGCREEGTAMFMEIPKRYNELKSLADSCPERPKIMLNSPYRDAWIMAPSHSYMAQLIRDAGGEYVFDSGHTNRSVTIDKEMAYKLISQADYWINSSGPGEFSDSNVAKLGRIYNNDLRNTPEGGNDFWESGIVHPDIILKDLITIFHPGMIDEPLHYYRKVE